MGKKEASLEPPKLSPPVLAEQDLVGGARTLYRFLLFPFSLSKNKKIEPLSSRASIHTFSQAPTSAYALGSQSNKLLNLYSP